MNNVEEILKSLVEHKLTLIQAEEKIRVILNNYRNRNFIEARVEEVASSMNDDGLIKLKIPYGYSKIAGIHQGDKVDLIKVY